MNRCGVTGCEEAAWTEWRGHDLCKACAEAASVWAASGTSIEDAENIVGRIAENLRKFGTRTGPEEPNR